jgi:uncharacterized protein
MRLLWILAGVVALALAAGCSSKPKIVAKPVDGPEAKREVAVGAHGRRPSPVGEDPEQQTQAQSPPPGGPYLDLDWGTLRGLDVRTGQTTPLIELAVGANVRISGYLVPFDDAMEETSEFLIVPSAGMCVHTPPPPPNQMVLAQASGKTVRMAAGAVWVYGKLDLDSASSPYGQTAYRMTAEAVRPYR